MKGFTLCELLIATGLLGILAAAGLTGLLQASTVARHIAAEQTLQERAQYALATLEADIQMAGYFGFERPDMDPAAAPAALPTLPCGTELLHDLFRGLEVQGQYLLSCAPGGRGSQPGAPVLILRRVSIHASAPEAGRVQWFSSLAEPEKSRLFWSGALPTGLLAESGRSEVRNLIVRAFYVARSSDGDSQIPSLRVKTLTAIAGNPAFLDTEVMPGVESLQIELAPDETRPSAVHVTLGLCDETAYRRGNAASSPPILFTRHFALRNLPHE
jgi:prepilin-type N-terminal cleavage/methylation domain-containing protein